MSFFEILLTALALSMDAFAVAMCKGLSMQKFRFRNDLIVGLYFGVFQGLMPLIGYYLGVNFAENIKAFDHWIAFGLLAFLGIKMLHEAMEKNAENEVDDALDVKTMFVLSVATSIDALAMGISFAVLHVEIFSAVVLIGVTTCILSGIGVKIGSLFGERFKKGAEIAGGIILICIGIKIVVEHLS